MPLHHSEVKTALLQFLERVTVDSQEDATLRSELLETLQNARLAPIQSQIPRISKPEKSVTVVILDTETTGLNTEEDRIVEFGFVVAHFDPETHALLGVSDEYCELVDPKIPISEDAKKKHGITDDDVKGKTLNYSEISKKLEAAQADLVVAHNAAYDAKMLEHDTRLSQLLSSLPWSCTFQDVDWIATGAGNRSLEYLSLFCGFDYASHRASDDVLALAEIISSLGILNQLQEAATRPYYVLGAYKSPFDAKDALKKAEFMADYSNGKFRSWVKFVDAESLTDELVSLKEDVKLSTARVFQASSYLRFGSRVLDEVSYCQDLPIDDAIQESKKVSTSLQKPALADTPKKKKRLVL